METIEYTVTDRHADGLCRGTVADLMLDAHLSPGCVRQPFELSEDDYWEAVARLERFTPEDLGG
jgi:hypothetical protein